jgi:hypothetical protein
MINDYANVYGTKTITVAAAAAKAAG